MMKKGGRVVVPSLRTLLSFGTVVKVQGTSVERISFELCVYNLSMKRIRNKYVFGLEMVSPIKLNYKTYFNLFFFV